jgi:O-antigen ligase
MERAVKDWRSYQIVLAVGFGAALAVLGVLASTKGLFVLALALPVGLGLAAVVVRWPFVGLLLIALLAQLDAVANQLFRGLPVSGVKMLTGLTLIGVALASYKEPRRERLGPDEPLLRLAVLFGLTLLLSFLFVEDRGLGLWSLRRMGSLLILLYLVVRLVTTVNRVRAVVFAVILSTLFSATTVIADWALGIHVIGMSKAAITSEWQGIQRSAGAADLDPTTSAIMLLTGTACAIILFLRWPRWRYLTGATALIGSAGIVLSYSRSSAVVFGLLLLWLLYKFRNSRRLPVALAAGLLALAVALPFVPGTYWERLATLTETNLRGDLSLRRRLGYNIIGVHILAERPLLGVGPGNYKAHYMDHKFRWMPGRGLVPRQLHNMYLEVATESGLVGLACFGGMLFLSLRSLNRVRKRGPTRDIRDLGEALHFAYVGLLLASLFMPNEYNKYVWIFTGLGVALGRIAANENAAPATAGMSPTKTTRVID